MMREMQIKTAMRYHLNPVGRDVVRKAYHSKYWRRHWGKGTDRMLLVQMFGFSLYRKYVV